MSNLTANEQFARQGNSPTSHRVNVGGRVIITHGLPEAFLQDIYHYAMTASWPAFFAVIGGTFLSLNAFFALIFLSGDHAIANQSPDGFLGAFFFSVETLATVGYGDMHPGTIFGHTVATFEIFVGMTSVALITGVMFARFSRPRARILFSEFPVIGQMDGKETFIIRAANARQNVIVDASARLRMLRSEVSQEGIPIRRLYDLTLLRDQHPIFTLGWTLMHVIDEASPLFGETPESLKEAQAGFILTINGVDETTSQTMQSRFNYSHDKLRWQHRYLDLFYTDEEGTDHMNYLLFHETRPIGEFEAPARVENPEPVLGAMEPSPKSA